MKLENSQQAFFALVKAGLWEQEARLLPYGKVDYEVVMRIAEEQSVVGLVTAGLEHVQDVRVPQDDLLQFIGQSLQIEQQNNTMNQFLSGLIEKMRKVGICTLLLKGQGIAQCYEKPLWRASGDIDFFLSEENYEKAKNILIPQAASVEHEFITKQHLGMVIDGFVVELHGSLHCGLSSRVDRGLDKIKRAVFNEGRVRSWMNGKTQLFLLKADEDVIYVFTHILQHFYRGGIGLRQICDWCRLLWTYRESLNHRLLGLRIRKAGLMSEWKVFAVFAVEYLGMPVEAMPLYSPDKKWKGKADKICSFIMEVGNFGYKRDMSYYCKYPYVIRKCYSMWMRVSDLFHHARIFPLDSLRFFPRIMFNGVMSAMRGE